MVIKRTRTHVIDTLAVREVISSLPENWLVRGMEERDYGIDLSIEIFDNENPTGRIALIQVKGKDSDFETPVQLSFPTKTIEYSLLFQEPFFVFHVSITEKKTYFVWLQKYAATKLEETTPKWNSQDSVTIYFPEENVLCENSTKIAEIMSLYSARSDGLEYLAAYEWMKEHWESFKDGEVALINSCLEDFKRAKSHTEFLAVHMTDDMDIDFVELQNCLEALIDCCLTQSGCRESIEDWVSSVDAQLVNLDILKSSFLDRSDMDKFCVEHSDKHPY